MSCRVDDCDKKIRTKGLCATHYMRLWRGDSVEKPLFRRGVLTSCKVEWCEKKILARHLCAGHYSRWREGRDLDTPFRQNWKGGITSENHTQRVLFRKYLLKEVLTRDSYTCQMCDTAGEYMHVDHIKSWADYPELRFELSNCRTLCRPCHYYLTFKRKLPNGSMWGKRVIGIKNL